MSQAGQKPRKYLPSNSLPLLADPNYKPATRGEEILQALDPTYWIGRGGQAAAGVIQGIPDWWNEPTAAAQPQEAPGAKGELFSDYLKGLAEGYGSGPSGGVSMEVPGGPALSAGTIAGPRPPTLAAPDYSNVYSALGAAEPNTNVAPLEARTVPGALTPEEQAGLVTRGRWSGAAQGALSAPENAGIGDLLFRAGLSSLAGRNAAEDKVLDVKREQEGRQFEFDARREERQQDRQDRLQVAHDTWSMQSAGIHADIANQMANQKNEQTKLEYDYSLRMHQAAVQAAQQYRPEVKIVNDKVVIIAKDPRTGQQAITVKPLDTDELGGLLGPGTAGDVQELQASGGDPAVVANLMVKHLERRGLLSTVFGPDTLQQVQEEVTNSMPAEFRTMGEEGRKMWSQRFQAELRWKLAEGLLQSPNLLDKTYGMLMGGRKQGQAPAQRAATPAPTPTRQQPVNRPFDAREALRAAGGNVDAAIAAAPNDEAMIAVADEYERQRGTYRGESPPTLRGSY